MNNIIKKSEFDEQTYYELSQWCNENQYTIEDRGDEYVAVPLSDVQVDTQIQKKLLQQQIQNIDIKLSELRGAGECVISVNGNNEYDVFKDGILVTMNETEFQNYFNELTNTRSDLLQQYKELK
ncbi:MAG: hypothetical protein E6X52_08810 [Actinomyces sp.]|jgi:hypothetical protein|nr:hypothetical protein [Actinomyces sp.]